MLEIVRFELGPVLTNSYLIADPETREAVVIDPAWDGHLILAEAKERNWQIKEIWLTHAHFDHFGGVAAVVDGAKPSPPVALHPEDLWLWKEQGGAKIFGFSIDPGPEPTIELGHNQVLTIGGNRFQVRHAPGHTPGHVVFYCAAEGVMFCGDVIFWGSIGRTDLPRGSYRTLIESIRSQVLTLPDDIRLLTGHGPETTVGHERLHNPFLI